MMSDPISFALTGVVNTGLVADVRAIDSASHGNTVDGIREITTHFTRDIANVIISSYTSLALHSILKISIIFGHEKYTELGVGKSVRLIYIDGTMDPDAFCIRHGELDRAGFIKDAKDDKLASTTSSGTFIDNLSTNMGMDLLLYINDSESSTTTLNSGTDMKTKPAVDIWPEDLAVNGALA